MIIKNAQVFDPDLTFRKHDLYIRGGVFASPQISDEENTILDASGLLAVPGFIDLHFHGACGMDVCDGTAEAFESIARYEAECGVTAICPATLTLPAEELKSILRTGAEFAKNTPADCADLVGFNMEGPFISHSRKGAQNEKNILACDAALAREFVDASGGLVKLIGLAPEMNPDLMEDYIREVTPFVKVSLAHTAADYDTASRAFSAGASHLVHMYNAMTGLHHRDPGMIGAVMDAGHATAEIICDGVHIHPSAVRAAFRMLGEDRMIFISDSLRCAGMPDGIYDLGGLAVSKKGALCTLADGGSIAGSVSNLTMCVQTAVKKMQIPLETAIRCASINPAKCLGIDDRYGSIETGKIADVVLLHPESLEVVKVIRKGAVL